MKKACLILAIITTTTIQHSTAQGCIDTLRIKGYYVTIKLKNEIGRPKVTQKNKTTKVLEQNIDVHSTSTFVPLDSIDKEHGLAYRLNHLWDNTKQVFVSCEKVDLKYLSSCSSGDTSKKQNCSFPVHKASKVYCITSMNMAEVYEILYLDAYWAKVKVKAESVEASLIPSRIAQTSVSGQEFDLYYFLSSNSVNLEPVIKDPKIKVY